MIYLLMSGWQRLREDSKMSIYVEKSVFSWNYQGIKYNKEQTLSFNSKSAFKAS